MLLYATATLYTALVARSMKGCLLIDVHIHADHVYLVAKDLQELLYLTLASQCIIFHWAVYVHID